MQFSKVLVPSVLASAVVASNVTVTTDVVVTDYTTYCPEPTSLVINNKTLTITEATTITVTGPCTIPTIYTSEAQSSTVAAESKSASNGTAEVTTYEAGAAKNYAGSFIGAAALAAALF